jgi:hypothetical protein
MTQESDTERSTKPAKLIGPRTKRNQARRERKLRSREARATGRKAPRLRRGSRLAEKKEARIERESTKLDWLKSDLKAKKHKFKLAYDTLEELSPKIDELIERIRKEEPNFDRDVPVEAGVRGDPRAEVGADGEAVAGDTGAGGGQSEAGLPPEAAGDVHQ